ncbi:MAG TPA: hypothetical protein VFX96_18720 [Pyrinomonadaceae bacterium]|nr:hypothetical protein [Pyrinomonadaceae bacterium]
MQQRDEGHAHTAGQTRATQPRREPIRNVGVRGCWELLIKIIILIILILILILWYFGRGGDFIGFPVGRYPWLILLILILLLLWLIWLQKHFVSLTCGLTDPTGCVRGETDILAGRVLEPVIGTASGIGFSRYELAVFWTGSVEVSIPDAVVYANGAGNPDTALTFGNHQVTSATLGFVDIQKLVDGAGAHIHEGTNFRLELYVIGIDGSRRTCTITFALTAARAFIQNVGGAIPDNYPDPNEPLRVGTGGPLATVGGGFHLRGAADPYGCSGTEELAEYSLWVKPDPDFDVPQPAMGTAYDPVSDGWTNITTATYTTADQRFWNEVDGIPDPDVLTRQSVWSTKQVWSVVWVDSMPTLTVTNVPYLPPQAYGSGTSGKYCFLLKVVDTAGNTYYDIQRAWIDNETIRGKIDRVRYQGAGDIPPCTDILINNGSGVARTIEVLGFATDPLIVATDTTTPTSDNFSGYSVWLRKQGTSSEVYLVNNSSTPVPGRATWTGGADPAAAVIATLDLRWLDAGDPGPVPNDAAGDPVEPEQRLARQTSCTYDIFLTVSDKTIVSESTHHSTGVLTFPVKIVNDLPL